MSQYHAPVDDMQFVLFDVFKAAELWQNSAKLADTIDPETAAAIIAEGGKISQESIAPFSRAADEHGVKYDNGVVTTPESFKAAYNVVAEGGWVGLTGLPEYGGMGMPKTLSVMVDEMMCSADLSFSLYVSLTSAAALTLSSHAEPWIKDLYLPKLYSGEWGGTMCLTESHAGTDLGMMHTKAKPNDDGSYAITGTKIFITAGEHDLTENIVHLVLAKLPDAPAGTRGISLFLVPKFNVDEQGNIGEQNAVVCGSVEHKMGISASATCVMNFDGAKGYLIGEPNRGLACMFTMMNYERLSMGSQGIGCAERSYQNALAYAKDRIQGRGIGSKAEKADPIIVHPDVRRMLLNMKSLTEAGRAFNTFVALQLDLAAYADDAAARKKHGAIAALLTPIAKAFSTDMGLDICVTGQQVFGGHGFIREWGQEQLVRDVRISQIYEGTNGIQALDLMGRKVVGDKGVAAGLLLDEIEQLIATFESNQNEAWELADLFSPAVTDLRELTDLLVEAAAQNPNEIGAASVEYLHIFGYVLYGYMWLKILTAAKDKDAEFYQTKLSTAQYYFKRVLPRVHSLRATVSAGSEVLYLLDDEQF